MALQLTGPINMQDIAVEFGGTGPLSLSQYYRGGGRVPNGPNANANIATSGAINMGSFYGATNRIPVTINITTNQTNYVFNTAKVPGYVAGITDVTFVIANGVVLSSNSTGVFAGDVDTSWDAGDTVRIECPGGFIVGMGGAGGKGADCSYSYGVSETPIQSYPNNAVAGSAGGPAFRAQRPITFNNTGTIAGGGGGGGGGGAGQTESGEGGITGMFAGGGGGGGRSSLTNSSGGAAGIFTTDFGFPGGSGAGGGTGTFSSQGTGGNSGNNSVAGVGGAGGSWGSAGGTSASGNITFGRVGGSGGAAVAGNGNITWLSTGTRLGAIT